MGNHCKSQAFRNDAFWGRSEHETLEKKWVNRRQNSSEMKGRMEVNKQFPTWGDKNHWIKHGDSGKKKEATTCSVQRGQEFCSPQFAKKKQS